MLFMNRDSKIENETLQSIRVFVLSLFGEDKRFKRDGLNPENIKDFINKNSDIHAAGEDFIQAFERIWLKNYPNIDLKRNVIKNLELPNLKEHNKSDVIQDDNSDPAVKGSSENPTVSISDTNNSETKISSPIPLNNHNPEIEKMSSSQNISDHNAAMNVLFHIKNAKAGHDYSGVIEKSDSVSSQLYFRSIRIPQELGLTSNDDRGEVTGIPANAGDHEITFQWSDDQISWLSGKCILMVNPDPRSLWQVNEPPADAPYQKAHTAEQLISCDSFKIVAASRRGRSHEHSGTFRDDDFFLDHNPNNGWSVIIVADGAGSARFSRQGSKLASQTFGEHIVTNLSSEVGLKLSSIVADWDNDPTSATNNFGTEFHYLFFSAATLAVQALNDEASSSGNNVKDYSTTLLAAAIKRNNTDTYLATFWMGDGAIVAYGPRRKVRLMGTPDAGEFAGQTRFLDRSSLSDQGFAKRTGIGRYADITSVILMTDGVSDPRFETDNGLANPDKWDLLWDEITPQLESDNPGANILKWLEFFSPGNHDDRTIAILW